MFKLRKENSVSDRKRETSLSISKELLSLPLCLSLFKHSLSQDRSYEFFDCENQRQVQDSKAEAVPSSLLSLSSLSFRHFRLYQQVTGRLNRRNVITLEIKPNVNPRLVNSTRSIPFDSTSTPPPKSTLPPFSRIPYSNLSFLTLSLLSIQQEEQKTEFNSGEGGAWKISSYCATRPSRTFME